MGTTYFFQVRGRHTNGKVSDWSSNVSATQLASPVAVTNLTAKAGNTQVTLTWDHLASYNISAYQIRRSDGSSWTKWTSTTTSTISVDGIVTDTVTGLTNGTSYSFQVRGEWH